MEDYSDKSHKFYLNQDNYDILKNSNIWIVKASIDEKTRNIKLAEIVQSDPWITYPYIISLEDRVKILNFHVPMAWIAVAIDQSYHCTKKHRSQTLAQPGHSPSNHQ